MTEASSITTRTLGRCQAAVQQFRSSKNSSIACSTRVCAITPRNMAASLSWRYFSARSSRARQLPFGASRSRQRARDRKFAALRWRKTDSNSWSHSRLEALAFGIADATKLRPEIHSGSFIGICAAANRLSAGPVRACAPHCSFRGRLRRSVEPTL